MRSLELYYLETELMSSLSLLRHNAEFELSDTVPFDMAAVDVLSNYVAATAITV